MSKRNVVAAVLASCALLAGPLVLAQQPQKDEHEGHHPEEQNKPPAAKPAPAKPAAAQTDRKGATPRTASPPAAMEMGMGMMDQKMKAMHEQMDTIRATQDPKERQRLMDEHMKSMQQGMAMMQGMTGGGGAGKSPASPAMRMDRMEQRMDMMQMMMGQMMSRQGAPAEEAPK